MKNAKKLLAIAIALVMLVSTLVSGLVVSAATPGSLTVAETTTVEVGEQAIVNFNINFGETPVNALHMLATITSDLAIVDAELGAVTYPNGEPVVDDELESPALRLDTKNLEAGKILFESGVDGAVTVTDVNFTVTFAAAEAAGDYAFAINVESTDYDEADFDAMTAAGTITVAAPHECVAGEAIDNGDGTHDVPCTGCDVLIKDDEPHNFVDGVCDVCGAAEPVTGPVEDPALKFQGASVGYGTSSLQVNFRVRNTVLALYDDVEVVIIPQKYDMTTLNLVETPTEIVVKKADLAAAGSTMKSYIYSDIQLYELGLDINYMLRGYDAEGNLIAVSETFTTSAASYLKTAYAASSDAKFRTLVADTLVVGQESVNMMKASYPDSDIATAASITEGFDLSEATPSIGTTNSVDTFNSYNDSYGTASSKTHQIRKSVSIGKAPFLAIRTKDSGAVLDLSKLSFRVTYTGLELDGSTRDFDKTYTNCVTKSGSYITFNFEEIGLGDGDKDLLIEGYYDGKKVYDLTYSMETYLSGMTSNASIGGVSTALLKLGTAFRAYATK